MVYIPANPVMSLDAVLDRRKLRYPPPGLFSVARHALLFYLDYLHEKGRRSRRVLMPDYMCHEVCHSLRQRGHSPVFYPLGPDFEPQLDALEASLREEDVILLAHFYGRICRRLVEVSHLVRRKGAVLIEDCVHLPYPYQPHGDFLSSARLYTLRKVYPVPYGALLSLREGQEDFARFCRERGLDSAGSLGDFWPWAFKQAAKKALAAAGLPYRAEYRDLSLDPLKPYQALPPAFRWSLSHTDYARCLDGRRKNHLLYSDHGDFSHWGEILSYDAAMDVPYMMVIFLEKEDPLEQVKRLMKEGIPASLGLALDQDVLGRLPPRHPYRRVLCLPIHQSLKPPQIRFIAERLDRGPHG